MPNGGPSLGQLGPVNDDYSSHKTLSDQVKELEMALREAQKEINKLKKTREKAEEELDSIKKTIKILTLSK